MKDILNNSSPGVKTCFIGDNENNAPVMEFCDMSIAYRRNSKRIKKIVDVSVDIDDLEEIGEYIYT